MVRSKADDFRSLVRCVFCATAVLFLGGCTFDSKTASHDVVFIVPGVGGNTPAYSSLIGGLRDGGIDANMEMFGWGAPMPLFVLNFQNETIHAGAEKDLAETIAKRRKENPNAKISCIGHSAGCGVILGALKRSDPSIHVDEVLLLAPSVSPTYDLAGAIQHINGKINVFYSDRDTVFLQWRTETFGTYDNIKSAAAGSVGFRSVNALPRELQAKVGQHPYIEAYKEQGNNGGHHDSLAQIAQQTLAPLLKGISVGATLASPSISPTTRATQASPLR